MRQSKLAFLQSGRLMAILVVAIVGVLMSAGVFFASWRIEKDRRDALFSEQLVPFTQHLPELLNERVVHLDSVVRLFNCSDTVSRDEFERFVSPIVQSKKDIEGIAWIPRVDASDRAKFEQEVRASGIPGFGIIDKQGGEDRIAGYAAMHFPYLYVSPVSGNATMLGYDAWGDLTRRRLLLEAMDKGSTAASSITGIILNSVYGGTRGVVLYSPVYKRGMPTQTIEQRREAIAGFVAMAMRPDELIKELGGDGLGKRFEVRFLDNAGDVQLSLAHDPALSLRKLSVAGRDFSLLCKPLKAFYDANPLIVPWLYLSLGLLLTTVAIVLFAYREMRMASFGRGLRRDNEEMPELRAASSIRLRIVLAVAVAMALMLTWFLLWTHRELSLVGKSASHQIAAQASKIWTSLVTYDADDLVDAYNGSLSDASISEAWNVGDRAKAKRMVRSFAFQVKLNSSGDSVVLAGADRRCIVRSDAEDGYGELLEFRMLSDSIRTGKFLYGVDMDPDGSIKLRLCAPFPSKSGAGQPLGFLMLTRDVSSYFDTLRRITGCELFVALFKRGLDERHWRSSSMKGLKQESSLWDDFNDFVPVYEGSLSTRMVVNVMSNFVLSGWNGNVDIDSGAESWSCATVPLADYSGRELGRLVVLRDASHALSAQRKTLAVTLAVAGALAIILVLAISAFAGAMEHRLLTAIQAREAEEDELHSLQDRLSSTLHSIGDAVISTDVDGKVTDMNSVAETLTGWRLAEAKGRRIESVFNLINAMTRHKGEIPVDRVLREGQVVGVANHSALISKDGVETQIADSAAPIRSSTGEVIGTVLVFRDVSADYKVRDELRKSEERFRLLAENARDAIFLMRVPSGSFDYISPAILSITGYPPEEFYKDGFLTGIVFKDDAKPFESLLSSAFAGMPPASAEFRIVRKDGRPVWISIRSSAVKDSSGKVVAIQGLATDISARKTIEEALRKSEGLYRTLVDNIDMGILFITPDRQIVMVNKIFANLLGKDVTYFIGRKCYEVVESMPDICPHCPGSLALESGNPAECEFDFLLPDGRKRRMHNRALPIKDKDGAISGFIETVADITDRKQADERKLHLEQQLLQSQKMESVGRLAGGIAHDFNNMLTPIIGYADMLLNKGVQDPKTASKLEQILKAANKARDLTRQLLAMGRKQTMQMRHLDMNEVVSGFERILLRTVREDIVIEQALSPSIGSIYGDPGQIEQIILNLAVNAQDAMPLGGQLKISTFERMVDEEFSQTHDGALVGGYVCLQVSDNGVGMDAELLCKIFEPFFTTKPHGKGTGLGLSTVYGIVKQHGGFIDVASEKGRGSVFTIFFPKSGGALAVSSVETSPAASCEAPVDGGGTECVLVAEDEENVLGMVAEMLRAKGYTVITATDGLKALEAASTRSGHIDLLLTDVVMPGLNGKALYERIKSFRQRIKVLFMSGYTNNLIGGGLQIGSGADYIQKPFTLDKLAAKVRSVLDGK